MWVNLKKTTTYAESSRNSKANASKRLGKKQKERSGERVCKILRRHVANFSM